MRKVKDIVGICLLYFSILALVALLSWAIAEKDFIGIGIMIAEGVLAVAVLLLHHDET